MILFAAVIFLSAFLLFQVQPVIAKIILPWFGGSSAVWSTCMLFFQAVLLLGYAYAHGLHERLNPKSQAIVHTLLLAASLISLPIIPSDAWKPSGQEIPSLRILALLGVTIGLPYFLLSTTSPLLQAWYARTHTGGMPYRLFALSNLASMLALLSYPFVVEPNFAARTTARIWSIAYACFVVLCAVLMWHSARRSGSETARAPSNEPPPRWGSRWLWAALAGCASILLLAVTTFLTQDIAAIPFLWILPLSLYLASFIVCFEAPQLYRRAVFMPLLAAALAAMAYPLQSHNVNLPVAVAIAVLAASLFVCCMVCHGELARLKPSPRHLTIFYLMISVGGAAGGVFVGLIAPHLFNAYYEYPLGLALCAALAVSVLFPGTARSWSRLSIARVLLLLSLAGYLVVLGYAVRSVLRGNRVVARNFYGQLRVAQYTHRDDHQPRRKLLHGVINHGEQLQNEPYRRQPATYFCPSSGIGHAMQSRKPGVPLRVGILGLGCGTLVVYGLRGDTFRIYEINPLVIDLARSEFTYLGDTLASVETVLGDGRLSLEREPSQQFDILIMDAFSGDSLPVHLITREAFQIYFRQLKPGGILAVNISNKYLSLGPVLAREAEHFGKMALGFSDTPYEDDFVCFGTDWVLVIDRAPRGSLPPLLAEGQVLTPDPNFRLWTDDFSNLLRSIK
ncbi:MAG: spermidine synthase [Bryobacteraceae bacterium]